MGSYMDIDVISAGELNKLISNEIDLWKYQIIDLRDITEYQQYHLKGAINIEYDRFMEMSEYYKILNKKKIIILYCDRGGRSIYAAKRLTQYGYMVKSLSGGLNEYIKSYG